MRISLIIPVFNAKSTLARVIDAVRQSSLQPDEFILVDDGSTDGSPQIAEQPGLTVIVTGGRSGPAHARNLGARHASGDLLVFTDADVALQPDALERIARRFAQEPSLDALIGSYDQNPADPGFVSQFKNLMHCFVHRHGNPNTWTFWCGCGAVKRCVFLEHGGLDESYTRPSIEDMEFGLRLHLAGGSLGLDPQIQGTHLKRWTLGNLVYTDVFQRGIPWTALVLKTGFVPDDLNLRQSQRVSVALTGIVVLLCGLAVWQSSFVWATGAFALAAVICGINHEFYAFLAARRGWGFALAAAPLHLLYYCYSGVAFVIGLGGYLTSVLREMGRNRAFLARRGEDSR